MTRLRLATRGSPLARAQSALVVEALSAVNPRLDVELVRVQTEGDVDRTTPLHILGGRGVFVRAVERALIEREAEIAVHSLKDVPTTSPEELALAAILPRGDPRDALVASGGRRLAELPAGARVGTSSQRRALLLRALRPDLELADVRGNVDTRLRKVASGEYDGVVLAVAGLERLGRLHEATADLRGAGVLALARAGARSRSSAAATMRRRASCSPRSTTRARARPSRPKRAILAELGSGCALPVGAFAQIAGGLLALRAMLGDEAAERARFGDAAGPPTEAEALGRGLARQLSAAPAASGRRAR